MNPTNSSSYFPSYKRELEIKPPVNDSTTKDSNGLRSLKRKVEHEPNDLQKRLKLSESIKYSSPIFSSDIFKCILLNIPATQWVILKTVSKLWNFTFTNDHHMIEIEKKAQFLFRESDKFLRNNLVKIDIPSNNTERTELFNTSIEHYYDMCILKGSVRETFNTMIKRHKVWLGSQIIDKIIFKLPFDWEDLLLGIISSGREIDYRNLEQFFKQAPENKIESVQELIISSGSLKLIRGAISGYLLKSDFLKFMESSILLTSSLIKLEYEDGRHLFQKIYLKFNDKRFSEIELFKKLANAFPLYMRDSNLNQINLFIEIVDHQILIDQNEALKTALFCQDDSNKNELLVRIIKKTTNVDFAMKVLEMITIDDLKNEALCHISAIQILTNHDKAIQTALSIKNEDWQNKALGEISRIQAKSDIKKAIETISLIKSDNRKFITLRSILENK